MKRNRYYCGKYLTAEGFGVEQAYVDGRLNQLAGMVFGKTVICGFEVKRLYSDTVTVSPGIAADNIGRLICLDMEATIPLRTLNGYTAQHELTLYACRAEKTDTDYVEEQAGFSISGENDAVPIADIVFENGGITSVNMRPKTMSSALSELIEVNIHEAGKLKKKLERLEKSVKEAICRIQKKCPNTGHGFAYVTGTNENVLFSEKILFGRENEPFFVSFGVVTSGDILMYGDCSLFGGTSDIQIARKAVRIMPDEGCFQLAVELQKPLPGRVIVLHWMAIGEGGRFYDFPDNYDC